MRPALLLTCVLGIATGSLALPQADSLRTVLAQARHDTAEVRLLNELAATYDRVDNDSLIAIATRAEALAERLRFTPGLAEAIALIGTGHLRKEEYPVARVHLERALTLNGEDSDPSVRRALHHKLAFTADQMSDRPEALKHYLAMLRIDEAAQDSAAIGDAKSMLGNLYNEMGDAAQAVALQREALAMKEAVHDTLGIAKVSNNLGTILDGLGRYDEALPYLQRALDMARALGDPFGQAMCLGSIANHYHHMGDLEQALAHNMELLPIVEQLGSPFHEAGTEINTGEILTGLKRFDEARTHLERGLQLARSVGAKQWLTNAHAALYELAEAQGNTAAGLEHYKLYIAYRDSITNEANTRKAVQEQMQYDFEKKEAVARAEHEEELRRQKLVRNGVIGGLALTLLFLAVVWRQRNRISAARKRSDELLLNILPEEVADELKATGVAEAKHFDTATILFTDFKGFTQLSEKVTPAELVEELNGCFKVFDGIMGNYRIEKIKNPAQREGHPGGTGRGAQRLLQGLRRHHGQLPHREDQDHRRCVHGRGRAPRPTARLTRRCGACRAGHAGLHAAAQGRARGAGQALLRDARGHPHRTGGGRHCGREEVPVRHLGRHREHGEPHGIVRRGGPREHQRGHLCAGEG